MFSKVTPEVFEQHALVSLSCVVHDNHSIEHNRFANVQVLSDAICDSPDAVKIRSAFIRGFDLSPIRGTERGVKSTGLARDGGQPIRDLAEAL
jgi:hypothetical protein